MKVYKLTTQDGKTRKGYSNETQWGEGITHEANGMYGLCGSGWLHFYYHPILAVILNPRHADISNPVLWEAEASGQFADDRGRKGGCTSLTTIKQIELPKLTTTDKTAFAILCARAVCKSETWNTWAGKWLSGEDRSWQSAKEARHAAAAYAAAYTAAYAAAYTATYAAAYADTYAAAYADTADTAADADAAFSYLPIITQWEAWREEEKIRSQS